MNNKLNSEMSAETAADKRGADDNTTSSHSSANTTVSGSFLKLMNPCENDGWSFDYNLINEIANKASKIEPVSMEQVEAILQILIKTPFYESR